MKKLLVVLCACTSAIEEPVIETQTAEHGTLRVRDRNGEIHEVTVVRDGGRAIYGGDVDLGAWSQTKQRGYASEVNMGNRWPENTVRFKFKKRPAGCASDDTSCDCPSLTEAVCDDLTADEKAAVRAATLEYERLTGIDFDEIEDDEPEVIPFVSVTGWDSNVQSRAFADASSNTNLGHTRLIVLSNKILDMDDGGYRTIIHEFGHALGFNHEQKRPDVASKVTLHPICMVDTSQFEPSGSTNLLTPFDMDSMMLYTSFSFTRGEQDLCGPAHTTNCCPTMLGVDGPQINFQFTNTTSDPIVVFWEDEIHSMAAGEQRTFTGSIIERTDDFSDEDLNALHQMYPPKLGEPEAGDRFGANAVAGDFNGDGYQDLAVAAPHEGIDGRPTSGAVMIYRGTYTGLAPWTRIEADPTGATTEPDDRFGAAMVAIDLDGDGNQELVVGAPNKRTTGTNRTGVVYVFNSNREGFTLRDYFFPSDLGYGNGTDDDFGFALDGLAENGTKRLFVGAPGAASASGRVYSLVYDSNATRHNVAGTGTFVFAGRWGEAQAANNRFGSAIASGDLDTDGGMYDDVVVGAPGAPNGGKLFVFKGSASSGFTQIGSISKPGTIDNGASFGRSVKLGQFRNLSSGKRQVAVGAPLEGTGRAYILDVTANSWGVSLDQWSLVGPTASGGQFGFDLGIGDLSGDGITDLVVGAPTSSSGFGSVHIFKGSGNSSLTYAAVGIQWTSIVQPPSNGLPGADNFGNFVAVGNFDKTTGMKDLAIGAPLKTRGGDSEAGAIWIYRGRPNGAPELPAWQQFTTFLDQETQPQK